jgi:formylglycine-generating enzyme required for sulfatase activity
VSNTREARTHQLWPVILSGEYFKSGNEAGVCDIVGNASEWTQDKGGQTYICGGSFKDWPKQCSVKTLRSIMDQYFSSESLGFRCAASLTEWMNVISKNKPGSAKED